MTAAEDSVQIADVIIVGAGPAGLAVAGCLRHAGMPFIMLERTAEVGASWRQHYDRLHLHTTKQFSALPYHSFPPGTPRYPSRQQMVDYLIDYAAHFQIEPHFNKNVESIRRVEPGWEIKTDQTIYRAQQVVLATGTNRVPNEPQWPGQDQYKGQILHTARYKNGEPFRGRKVLVVGFGNSGTEIAIDLWEHGARPSLAVRGAVNVVRRDMLGIIPVQMLSILLKPLPSPLVDRINAPFIRLQYGKLSHYHLQKLPYGAATQISVHGHIPMIDIGIMKLIRDGQVAVYPGIAEFTPDGVIFSDGRQEAFDVVVLATGYRSGLEDILPSEYALLNENGFPYIAGRSTTPGLYFAGFYISGAGMLYEINREAHRIVRAIIEKTTTTR